MTYKWAEDWFLQAREEIERMEKNPFSADNADRLKDLEEKLKKIPALFAEESQYEKQLENVREAFSLGKVWKDQQRWAEDNILPFLAEWKEEIYVRGCVFPFPERWKEYEQEEFAIHHANQWGSGKMAPQVSVFVPACNHLEATKRCVESILRHTKKEMYELLLIDHGSTDDTFSWFCGVEGARVMHMKENVRMLMFTAAYRACKGKYIAFVSNDTEVTEGWLERLVCCLEQTPGAVSATPVTPYTSNFQGVVSLSEEERARFVLPSVQQGNWRQRSRIMPVIGVYDKEKVNAIGFADRIFWSMEFWDDDFSFRARRKGYRQMLCTEVYCHHLGSLTGGEAWAREKTLERGREIFRKKHQMDPWAKGFCRQADFMTLLEMWKPAWQKMDCLAIDCGYGDAAMEAGNHCRMFGTQTFWQAITTERMFLPDAIGFAEKWEYARNLEETLYRCFEKNRFHFILREEVSHEGLLRLLGQGLVAGGILMTLSDLDVLPDFERIGQRGKWRMWQKKMG